MLVRGGLLLLALVRAAQLQFPGCAAGLRALPAHPRHGREAVPPADLETADKMFTFQDIDTHEVGRVTLTRILHRGRQSVSSSRADRAPPGPMRTRAAARTAGRTTPLFLNRPGQEP